ncbi:MAG: adenine-specific methyltransferase EcoRI family protein [Firmicutes bacterium]|nr:adenine-specific methyltransferase EcoRI family protein [Bacillota bacterium]
MEKQRKVVTKIKYESGKVTPLGTEPNDECYTAMQDIVNELAQYGHDGRFRGKDIICPCDWDILEDEEVYSLRVDFDEDIHAHTNDVKLISYEKQNGALHNVRVEKEEIDKFLRERTRCNFLRTLIENANTWGIKSVSVSGYNPATGKGKKFQDVDYSQYDICITNPPFSRYAEFIETLVKTEIDFIILAPFLNRVNPCVGIPLLLKQCYLGYGRKLRMNFFNPTIDNEYNTKLVACDWITTFYDAQEAVDKSRLLNGIKYEDYEDEYMVMENMTMKDGTHPIRVNNFRAIPDDYYGWMFCSIGVLDILSNEEFEWYGTGFKGYLNTNRHISPFEHRASNEMVSNANTKGFHGVVIRRRRI